MTFRSGTTAVEGPRCALACQALPFFMDWIQFDEPSRSRSFWVGSRSAAVAMIFEDPAGYWCPDKRVKVEPGEVRFQLVPLGTIDLGPSVSAADVELLDFDRTLAEWHDESGQPPSEVVGERRRVSTPAGSVRWGGEFTGTVRGGAVLVTH